LGLSWCGRGVCSFGCDWDLWGACVGVGVIGIVGFCSVGCGVGVIGIVVFVVLGVIGIVGVWVWCGRGVCSFGCDWGCWCVSAVWA
jgi:hypothetical protein